jgi:STE24 endopeptidase
VSRGISAWPEAPLDAEGFLLAFLLLFALNAAVDLLLNVLNRREVRRHQGPPPAFAGRFDAGTFARSRAYTLERLGFDRASLAWGSAVTLSILFSGLLPWLDRILAQPLGRGPAQGAAFMASVALLQAVLTLPLSAWSAFRIEGGHGFNTMTWGLYWKDAAKELILSLALGLPLLYLLFRIMEWTGPLWWLWGFLAVFAFQMILAVIYPVLIAPLFNRFKPMEEGDLKASLIELAARLRFPARGIFVMDGSRRSLHSNAYFTGFGRFRRIVLFDTLLGQMAPPELRSVLAHEIGHYKLGHIRKLLIAQSAMLLLLFYLASLAIQWAPLYQAFGFPGPEARAAGAPGPAVGLFLFLTAFSRLSLLIAPIRNLLSRRHEYQADAFAVKALRDPDSMRDALIKLSRKNLSNLTPHPWYSAFHYSHPALAERIAALGAKSP